MRNCGQACFVGNKSVSAVTRNRCRFEEVGNLHGEERGGAAQCSVCVWRERGTCSLKQQEVELCLHVGDQGQTPGNTMWITAVMPERSSLSL